MPRRRTPKNRLDPGSKLTESQTLKVIAGLIMGGGAKDIAQFAETSENTVSSVSKKFREKLWTDEMVRMRFFEPFYGNARLTEDEVYFIRYAPTLLDEAYMPKLARCIFDCPSTFPVDREDIPTAWFRHGNPLINSESMIFFLDELTQAFPGNQMYMRPKCTNCTIAGQGPFSMGFIAHAAAYLKKRKLTAFLREYFLLLLLNHHCLRFALEKIGLKETNRGLEMRFPNLATPALIASELKRHLFDITRDLVTFAGWALVERPLEASRSPLQSSRKDRKP